MTQSKKRRKPARKIAGARRGGRHNTLGAADPMVGLRTAIDRIDVELVALLNRRARHAISVGRLKQAAKLPIYQPAREEEVLANIKGRNSGPLEDTALRRVFERIIDESRRLERLAVLPAPDPGAAHDVQPELPDGATD